MERPGLSAGRDFGFACSKLISVARARGRRAWRVDSPASRLRRSSHQLPAAELVYNVDSSLVYKRLIALQIRVGSGTVSRQPRHCSEPQAETGSLVPRFDWKPGDKLSFFHAETSACAWYRIGWKHTGQVSNDDVGGVRGRRNRSAEFECLVWQHAYSARHQPDDSSESATALIGPSGCGKSTFVRCLNRMHETNPIARVTGSVKLGDLDIYNDAPPVAIRRRVGMVFQRPNPFPTMSIYDNVASWAASGRNHEAQATG